MNVMTMMTSMKPIAPITAPISTASSGVTIVITLTGYLVGPNSEGFIVGVSFEAFDWGVGWWVPVVMKPSSVTGGSVGCSVGPSVADGDNDGEGVFAEKL